MKKSRPVVAVIFAAILLLVASCSNLTPGGRQSAAYTAGASTLIARLTMEAGNTAVGRLTQIASAPSATLAPTRRSPPPKISPQPTPIPILEQPQATELPTPEVEAATATPTLLLGIPTFTTPSLPCNRMELLGDVSVPPDTIVAGGTVFNKAWRVRNNGACTWNVGYALISTGGSLSGAGSMTLLPIVVEPGQTVDLSLLLVAPTQPGTYESTWLLRSDRGELFGTGADGTIPLFARIHVLQTTADRGAVYDIAANACDAAWSSAEGRLSCPGARRAASGSVLVIQSPTMETGATSSYGLLTRPNQAGDGWISGQTPLIDIRSSDRFTTEIGCLSGATECDVNFQLDYTTRTGATGRLGRWRETYDGLTSYIEVDLSSFAGTGLRLTLSVFNRGRARDADAIWLLPRIQSGSTPGQNVLTWTREGRPNAGSCDELRINRTGSSATAVAFDCAGNSFELGRAGLNSIQLDQLRSWEANLQDFNGEIFSASGGNPVTTWVVFQGSGPLVAGQSEIQALNAFALQLFNQITRQR